MSRSAGDPHCYPVMSAVVSRRWCGCSCTHPHQNPSSPGPSCACRSEQGAWDRQRACGATVIVSTCRVTHRRSPNHSCAYSRPGTCRGCPAFCVRAMHPSHSPMAQKTSRPVPCNASEAAPRQRGAQGVLIITEVIVITELRLPSTHTGLGESSSSLHTDQPSMDKRRRSARGGAPLIRHHQGRHGMTTGCDIRPLLHCALLL